MIGPVLLVIGLLGLWALAKGKAEGVLDAITQTGFSTSLQNSVGNLQLGSGGPDRSTLPSGSGTTNAAMIPGQTSGTSLFNVAITGPDGTAGTIQVIAHDAASAIINAMQGGNIPRGPAISV